MSGKFRYKQCIVLRTDLGMSVGKLCVQAAHASVMVLRLGNELLTNERCELLMKWMAEGQKKVVLEAPDEATLWDLHYNAHSLGIYADLVMDAGMTEVEPGTVTALGLGPALEEDMNKVTGNLPLFKGSVFRPDDFVKELKNHPNHWYPNEGDR